MREKITDSEKWFKTVKVLKPNEVIAINVRSAFRLLFKTTKELVARDKVEWAKNVIISFETNLSAERKDQDTDWKIPS